MRRVIWLVVALTAVLASTALGQPRQDPFARADRNGDGKLSPGEVPPRMQRDFERIDADGDGFLSRQEIRQFMAARRGGGRPDLPPPDHADVRYGPHERNVLDLWLAEAEEPTPLVIYYHGGGFRGGDKSTLQPPVLQGLLEAGISVAAANYRLTDVAPFPAQMHDGARALQFLRLHADEYGLDPERVAATGGSAGSGISQWLAFHDDLADPGNDDEVLQQSTRLTCAAVMAAQSTYDPRVHLEMFETDQVDPAMVPFYGMDGPEDVSNPEFFPLFEEASPINHVTDDDPPLFLFYPQANEELPPNPPGPVYIHHPKFGFLMQEALEEAGVECVLRLSEDYSPEDGRGAPMEDMVEFLVERLARS
jgi:acetyl esterase/lipase